MLVSELMSREPKSCGPNDPLSTAARIMWELDCGAVPVVDREGRPIGIITDRDIAMAAYIQGRAIAHLRIADSMAREVFTCRGEDTVEAVARVMAEGQIHRVPVVDGDEKLVGIVALADVARVVARKAGDVAPEELARVVASIRRARRLAPIRGAEVRPRRTRSRAQPAQEGVADPQ